LFAQRDRLPWFWFFAAVAVSVLAAFDRVDARLRLYSADSPPETVSELLSCVRGRAHSA
jgi:hypothetical protein